MPEYNKALGIKSLPTTSLGVIEPYLADSGPNEGNLFSFSTPISLKEDEVLLVAPESLLDAGSIGSKIRAMPSCRKLGDPTGVLLQINRDKTRRFRQNAIFANAINRFVEGFLTADFTKRFDWNPSYAEEYIKKQAASLAKPPEPSSPNYSIECESKIREHNTMVLARLGIMMEPEGINKLFEEKLPLTSERRPSLAEAKSGIDAIAFRSRLLTQYFEMRLRLKAPHYPESHAQAPIIPEANGENSNHTIKSFSKADDTFLAWSFKKDAVEDLQVLLCKSLLERSAQMWEGAMRLNDAFLAERTHEFASFAQDALGKAGDEDRYEHLIKEILIMKGLGLICSGAPEQIRAIEGPIQGHFGTPANYRDVYRAELFKKAHFLAPEIIRPEDFPALPINTVGTGFGLA